MSQRWQGKRVGVLMGGVSKEREISLRTGRAMSAALQRRGYHVVEIDVTLNLVEQLRATPIDVAVIALHGKYGEDGTIQGLLEFQRIPYAGTGVCGSAVAMDKILCKRIARDLEIPVAMDLVFHANADSVEQLLTRLSFELPVVVKPVREGSTIGLAIVRALDALPSALQLAAGSDEKILIEEYIAGKEVTVGILCGQVLPTIEIAPKHGFYDYTAKYTKGMTDYILPARIPAETTALLGDWTARLWRELECRGWARADYIVRDDGSAVLLELNTIPGMTETSLVPKAAAYLGIAFDEVCERILNDAGLRMGGM
ncbi:MAG: D-alanine--D-alanine ligase [Deltaproteobacteria bacterium]|nr:D-alanine--D-alanine ligase [Deltaproteobacteria bacterium]